MYYLASVVSTEPNLTVMLKQPEVQAKHILLNQAPFEHLLNDCLVFARDRRGAETDKTMGRELIDLIGSIDIDESHICDGQILLVGLPSNLVMHNVTSDVMHAISDFLYGRGCYKGI